MNLNDVNAQVATKPTRKRVGRGPGSGNGGTAGRGMNGAKSRSGWKSKPYYEGGQMPFIRRIPKRGFSNKPFKRDWAFVNLKDLNALADGTVVTAELLLERGIIPKVRSGLKVLGVGTLERKLTIRAHRASETAKKAIEAAGGQLELLKAAGDDAAKSWKQKRGAGKSTLRREKAKG
jgi:large subunit ribosomal protein L15